MVAKSIATNLLFIHKPTDYIFLYSRTKISIVQIYIDLSSSFELN